MRLLLVEDSELDARLVREELADLAPVELHVARTLAAARAHLATERADCVLLDLRLPDATGLEGVEALRELRPELPIVVLSGAAQDELAVRAVQVGAQDVLIKDETPAPALLRAVRHAIERKRSERRLTTLAMSDPLTGLPNRALLLERAHLALERMARAAGPPRPVGLLFLDLDRFKLVNDSLGHAAGDELLAEVARRLRAAVGPADTVARFGGDEFAVLCPAVEDAAALDALAASVRAALSRPLTIDGTELFPSGSIGVALAAGAADTPEQLLREADAAMYRAKAATRGSDRYAAGPDHTLRTEAELHNALRRGELVVHYQPVVRLGGAGEIAEVEALVRWRHPERGLVGPDEFLGTAEDSGLIRRLGAWVLQEGCRQLAAWDAAGIGDGLTLAVNVSARQLDDEALVPLVASALVEHGLTPDRLCLEIGAGADRSARLEALRNIGIRIAIDARRALAWATGGGDAPVPVDVVKLDRRFVSRMDIEPQARRIVAAVVALAHSMGAEAVAEGLEDDTQVAALLELGCELGQGHAFAAAAPAAELEPLLVRSGHTEPVRVYICDDAPALRMLLHAFLECGGDVDVVGEAADGEGLTASVLASGADVVLLDLSMPRVDGMEALADLRAAAPELGIVVLSGFEEERMGAKALALGADRYVEKGTPLDTLRTAIREVGRERVGVLPR